MARLQLGPMDSPEEGVRSDVLLAFRIATQSLLHVLGQEALANVFRLFA